MKYLAYIVICLLIVLGLFFMNSPNIVKTKTIYKEGKSDTITIRDTVTLTKIIRSNKIETIDVYNDSSKTLADSIRTSWCYYGIKVDSLVDVLGKVRLNGEYFEFDSTTVTYPKYMIKQIDTLEITKLIKANKAFYEDEWFYVSAIAIIISIL